MGGLLLNDKYVGLRLATGQYDGTEPSFTGTAADVMAYCREFRLRDSVEVTNTKGAGTLQNQNRYHSQQGTIEMTLLVPNTGTRLIAPLSGKRSPVLRVVEVSELVLSTLEDDPTTYVGVIREYEEGGTMDEVQTVRITLDLDFDVQP